MGERDAAKDSLGSIRHPAPALSDHSMPGGPAGRLSDDLHDAEQR